MTRRSVGRVGLALASVAVLGGIADRFGDRPHASMAVSAAGVMFVAAVLAGAVEARVARQGGESLVLGYWVGVGVRGTVGLVGAMMVARFGFGPADRQAFCLWMLTAYLTVLCVETVRVVRDSDRARSAKTRTDGGTEWPTCKS